MLRLAMPPPQTSVAPATEAGPAEPSLPSTAPPGHFQDVRFPVAVYLAVSSALYAVIAWSVVALPDSGLFPNKVLYPHRWLAGWVRWDAGWYWAIADNGYSYNGPGQQSPVAFFPGYPLLLRGVSRAFPNTPTAGIALTFVLGLVATIVLHQWALRRLGAGVARMTVVALLLYPFSWFLVGAVYSDALFLLCAVGAFALLERDRIIAAGLVGALATATRPVGPALIVAMCVFVVAKTADREGGWIRLPHPSRLRPKDAGVLLSVLGVVGYAVFLQRAFGDPLAFIRVQSAEGWNHTADLSTLLKVPAWRTLVSGNYGLDWWRALAQGLVTLLAAASIPLVWRRLGSAYAVYVALLVVVPVATSADFTPMGRYLLAAFPMFAAAGLVLERWRWSLALAPLSVIGLVYFASMFSRWYLIT